MIEFESHTVVFNSIYGLAPEYLIDFILANSTNSMQNLRNTAVADPGKDLTGALHSNFGRGGCGGRG